MDDGEDKRDRYAHATSADADALILVDTSDHEIGFLSKGRCHQGGGILHRAFSLLIFNDAGELLLQQRSAHNGCGRCTGRIAAAVIRGDTKASIRPSSRT
jgi:hypothetical protein